MQCLYVHVQWNNSQDHSNFGLRARQSEAWILVLMICWYMYWLSMGEKPPITCLCIYWYIWWSRVLDMFDNLTLNEHCPSALVSFAFVLVLNYHKNITHRLITKPWYLYIPLISLTSLTSAYRLWTISDRVDRGRVVTWLFHFLNPN